MVELGDQLRKRRKKRIHKGSRDPAYATAVYL